MHIAISLILSVLPLVFVAVISVSNAPTPAPVGSVSKAPTTAEPTTEPTPSPVTNNFCACIQSWDPVCCQGKQYSNINCASCDGYSSIDCASNECGDTACNEIYDPYCCKGTTYENSCTAKYGYGFTNLTAQCNHGQCGSCVCTKQYDPYCCDGKEYGNDCVAKCNGYLDLENQCIHGHCQTAPTPAPVGSILPSIEPTPSPVTGGVSGCTSGLDLIFVVDSSGSVYDDKYTNWQYELDAMKAIVNSVLPESKSRVGLINFSGCGPSFTLEQCRYQQNRLKKMFGLNDYGAPYNDLQAVYDRIDQMGPSDFNGGYTWTREALHIALTEFQSNSSANVNKAIILVSDGEPFPYNQNHEPCRTSTNYTSQTLTDLRNIGVKIIAAGVAITQSAEDDFFRCIVEDYSTDFYLAADFSHLTDGFVQAVSSNLCKISNAPTPVPVRSGSKLPSVSPTPAPIKSGSKLPSVSPTPSPTSNPTIEPETCGGFPSVDAFGTPISKTCETGYECIDDPRDDCVWGIGQDCPGICVKSTVITPTPAPVIMTHGCYEIYDPYCCDGVKYDNDCYAFKNGFNVTSDDRCYSGECHLSHSSDGIMMNVVLSLLFIAISVIFFL